MTYIVDTKEKRAIATFIFAVFIMFSFQFISGMNLSTAGTIGSLVMGICANQFWKANQPRFACPPEKNQQSYGAKVQKDLEVIWVYICQPLLFALIGSSVKFRDIETDLIGKSIALVFIGTAIRTVIAFGVLWGPKFNYKERLLIAIAWIPKATVQAALASNPLNLVKDDMDQDKQYYDQYLEWGDKIQTTAVFYILITAPKKLIIYLNLRLD
ncbi:hypothetical protein PPERSA_04822 [Pseudocohnilembus persalinus]|uniref:Cation/H+ exchanger transmembrane domain-containing protein n=1 Tax=Pseudocohnilembus persalinus TaxID=266149 RepID=A0A0V0QL25_PSEPJ|nr:hypothetical protein PPERSA_04822 [Pseudocohnilembus persalinus]|eukprot:KRX03027.1 hypothetical protein PPERSA_04822 [Pseudocohnilembus persalinus]